MQLPGYGCLFSCETKSGNQLHKGRYGEWLALYQVLGSKLCYASNFVYMLGTTIKLTMLFQVLGNTCTLERIVFSDFGLAVTEISTKKYRNKKIKRCRDGMPKTM